jgi:hypothetical protein
MINHFLKILLFISIISCKAVQPNYNRDSDHNSSVNNRMKEVYRVDKLSKKRMIKVRKSASKVKLSKSHVKKSRYFVR